MRPVDSRETRERAATEVESRWRDQCTERREDTRERRIDHDRTFPPFRDIAGVDRAGAAEREQRQPAIVDATIDRMRTCGGGHGFADHAVNSSGSLTGCDAERCGESGQLPLGAGAIELHVATEEIVGTE